jgi:YVTN family beta-propeller protein
VKMKPILSKRSASNLALLGILCLWMALPLAARTVRIYVTNHAGTTITVVDPATNKVVQEIKNFEVPEAIHFSPDGSRAYITQGGEKFLTVLDRKTGDVIKKVPISGHPNDLAVTNDGKWILVCVSDIPGGLDFIDASSLEKVKTLPATSRLHDVVISQDDKYAVATSPQGKFFTVFDLKKQEVAWHYIADQDVLVPALENAPDGSARRVFVELSELNGFAVIDFESHKEAARITFPDDLPKVVPSGTPTHGLGVSPDGKTIWAVSRLYDSVFVYSVPELKLLGHARLPELDLPGHGGIGGSPNWITFAPDSKTAYVANAANKTVSVIDAKSLKVLSNIPMGEQPGRMSTLALP